MTRWLLLALLLALLGGCVTPGDLRDVSLLVEQFGEDLADESKTVAEVKASAIETAAQIEEVGERALERTENVLTVGQGTGLAGALSTAAAVVLHLYRNRRERRILADRRRVPRDGPDRRQLDEGAGF